MNSVIKVGLSQLLTTSILYKLNMIPSFQTTSPKKDTENGQNLHLETASPSTNQFTSDSHALPCSYYTPDVEINTRIYESKYLLKSYS